MLNYTLLKNGKPVKMYNICGRTEKQQAAVDAKAKKDGGFWGILPILYEFVFTKTELNAVERATETLVNHAEKLNRLVK
jgi:hypothetical protein